MRDTAAESQGRARRMRRTLRSLLLLVAMAAGAASAQETAPPAQAIADGGDASTPAKPACPTAPGPSVQRAPPATATRAANRIAVTLDDLPWVMDRNAPPADLSEQHARLLAALRQACIPVIGFVNDGKLYQDDTLRPERMAMLEDWLRAGFELGNHTAWHSDLHAVGPRAFEADILDGERQLKPLLAKRGLAPRWFRHPFLRTGRSPEEKAAIDAFLADHGYRTAPVTVNSSEWIYALAYRKTLTEGGDADTLAKVKDAYVAYMLSKLSYYARRSNELLGYNVPQVLLLHANEINAASMPELVAQIRARGYRFVSLDEATADPAYARPDHYAGELGTSWIHRWARTEGVRDDFYFGETPTPAWVKEIAGVAAGAE